MKIIKRDGTEVEFNVDKITMAVTKANNRVEAPQKLSELEINSIGKHVQDIAIELTRALTVEEIQDLVENDIMSLGKHELAKRYITYRYNRSLARKANTTDGRILSLINCNNEDVKQENSNKNPIINSVQRDYMAGEVSKDISSRILLPRKVVEAHDAGLIHFHDMDYFAQRMHNCCLLNLEDMLQNGTVISGTQIDRPKSFATACNIAPQIIAQVASNQYGGQSISLAHLAPFVEVSRKKIRAEVEEELKKLIVDVEEAQISQIVEGECGRKSQGGCK